MDSLKEIIDTLDEQAVREFRIFLSRKRKRKERVDWAIFQFLRKADALTPEEMATRFCKNPNPEAYFAIRKRLMRELGDFVVLQTQANDTTAGSAIMGSISLARYLFTHKLPEAAWEHLRRAEQMALTNEQYKLLTGVYILMIEFAHLQHRETLQQILVRYEANIGVVAEEDRAIIAHSVIRQRLAAQQQAGVALDFEQVVQDTLASFGLTDAVLRRPKLLFNVISIIRSAYLANKDFVSFESYMLSQYEAVKARGGFDKHHHYYKIYLLYLIAHILYRNRKFAQATAYLHEMEVALEEHGRSHYNLFYHRYALMRAAVQILTGELPLAMTGYQTLAALPTGRLDVISRMTAYLNLTVCYLLQGNDRQALTTLNDMGHSDKWIIDKMGKEWLLKKLLFETIIHIELGNHDLALLLVRRIERKFIDVANQERPIYNKLKPFLAVLKREVHSPGWLASAHQEILQQFPIRPNRQEDTQAMVFFAWMVGHATRAPFYPTLLGIVQAA